jgi:hypothetical protein
MTAPVVPCPGCQTQLTVPPALQGGWAFCPRCRWEFAVAAPVSPSLVYLGVRCYDCDRAIPEGESVRQTRHEGDIGQWWPLLFLAGKAWLIVLLLMASSAAERVSLCPECSWKRERRECIWKRERRGGRDFIIGCLGALLTAVAIAVTVLVVSQS